VIESKLKEHAHAGEDASTILGDKLQQKMDAVTFAQERMKRQLADLQDKTGSTPTDVHDMRERIEDCEREVAKIQSGGGSKKDKAKKEEDVDSIRKEVDYIMGRGTGTGAAFGVPTLVSGGIYVHTVFLS
jgi:chromosome segregation ATPase